MLVPFFTKVCTSRAHSHLNKHTHKSLYSSPKEDIRITALQLLEWERALVTLKNES